MVVSDLNELGILTRAMKGALENLSWYLFED